MTLSIRFPAKLQNKIGRKLLKRLTKGYTLKIYSKIKKHTSKSQKNNKNP